VAANPFRRRLRRPPGVTLLSVWSVVVGIGVLALAAYAVYGIRTIPQALAAFTAAPESLVVLAGLVALLEVLTALGLWRLRPWGWLLAVAFSVAGIVLAGFTLPYGVVGAAFGVASTWYLAGRPVRQAFGIAAKASARP